MSRVLVVDDDQAMSALIEVHLEQGGHRVVVANSPGDAIAIATEREAPEVVVLDVAMPDMTGFELLKVLRDQAHLSNLPAVFLSARVTTTDIETGRVLGAMYLRKPVVAATLLTAVGQVVEDASAGTTTTPGNH